MINVNDNLCRIFYDETGLECERDKVLPTVYHVGNLDIEIRYFKDEQESRKFARNNIAPKIDIIERRLK